MCLAGIGLVYWLTVRTGFSAVVNPDSNPTLSLSVYMFFAPALLWLGAALLLVRLRGGLVAWLAARAGGGRPRTGRRGPAANRRRRGGPVQRGLAADRPPPPIRRNPRPFARANRPPAPLGAR